MHRFRTLLFVALAACLILPLSYAQDKEERGDQKDGTLHKAVKVRVGDEILELKKLMGEIQSGHGAMGQLLAEPIVMKGETDDQKAVLGIHIDETEDGQVLIVDAVKGGPAGKAGLKAGDIILKVNGKAIPSMDALMEVMQSVKPGNRVNVIVSRDGKKNRFAFKTGGFDDVFENEDMVEGEWIEEIEEEVHEHGDHAEAIHGGVPKSGRIQIGEEVIEFKGSDGEHKIITRGIPKSGRFFGLKLDDEEEEENGEEKDIRIIKTADGEEIMLVAPKAAAKKLHGNVFLHKHDEDVDSEDDGDEEVEVIETDNGKRIIIKKKSKVTASGGKGHVGGHSLSIDVEDMLKGLPKHGEQIQTKTFTIPGGKGVIQMKVLESPGGENKCNVEVHVEQSEAGECSGTCKGECAGTCEGECAGTCGGECAETCDILIQGCDECEDAITILGHGNKHFTFKPEPKKKAKAEPGMKKKNKKNKKNKNRKKNKNKRKKASANTQAFDVYQNVIKGQAHPPVTSCSCCAQCKRKHKCCGHDVSLGGHVIQSYGFEDDGGHASVFYLRKGDGGYEVVPAHGPDFSVQKGCDCDDPNCGKQVKVPKSKGGSYIIISPPGNARSFQVKRGNDIVRELHRKVLRKELP